MNGIGVPDRQLLCRLRNMLSVREMDHVDAQHRDALLYAAFTGNWMDILAILDAAEAHIWGSATPPQEWP